jgi:hypothetical protein
MRRDMRPRQRRTARSQPTSSIRRLPRVSPTRSPACTYFAHRRPAIVEAVRDAADVAAGVPLHQDLLHVRHSDPPARAYRRHTLSRPAINLAERLSAAPGGRPKAMGREPWTNLMLSTVAKAELRSRSHDCVAPSCPVMPTQARSAELNACAERAAARWRAVPEWSMASTYGRSRPR